MRIFARLLDADPEPRLLDHLPVQATQDGTASVEVFNRDAKLLCARGKLGRPFKCGPKSIDREVIVVPGHVAVAPASGTPTRKDAVPDADKEYGSWGAGLTVALDELPADVARNVRQMRRTS